MTKLKDMNQDQLIAWINTLQFSVKNKNKIIDGIKQFAEDNDESVTGSDFIDADAENLRELTSKYINGKIATSLLAQIKIKQEEDFHDNNEEKKDNNNNHNDDDTFTLSLIGRRGGIVQLKDGLVEIKNVTKSWTVSQVNAKYLEHQGNFKAEYLDLIVLRKSGRMMRNEYTLEYYGIVSQSDASVPLTIHFTYGGGPNVTIKNDKVEREWGKNGPAYRSHVGGLNVEFRYNDQKIIGQVGYTTDPQKFPNGKFEAHNEKHIKMAYCPNKDVFCPNHDAVVRYWFNNCKVIFNGELKNGDQVHETEIYGNKATYYKGNHVKYADLAITVTPNKE